MDITQADRDEQTKRWNGPAGRAWVDAQELLDRTFKPLEDLLVDLVAAEARGPVLDVGCGAGGTTLAVARKLGPALSCTGVDISEVMIAAARARAERESLSAYFLCADAQTHGFEPTSVDMLISRFGVMFFADPPAAFANLRRAAARDATLRFIAWRGADENPFMTTAERAAAPLLPDLPPRRASGPGQFAFADRDLVRGILAQGGWSSIDIQPIDVACTLPETEMVGYLTRLGPVGLALQDADESTRMRIAEAVRPAFDPFVDGDNVRFNAACWMIGARAAA